jgi:signal transduction histidine kinase
MDSPRHDVTLESPSTYATLAHELSAPLAAIVSAAEAIADARFGPLGEPYIDYARLIRQAGADLLHLIAALAPGADPDETTEDPVCVVADHVALMQPRAATGKVRLSFEASELGPGVVAAQAFRRIVVNLLDNALKATAPGGRIQVVLRAAGPDVMLEVGDSGGVAFTGGRGLGLSIVRALCAVHGGAFDLRLGQRGATAIARLPLMRR